MEAGFAPPAFSYTNHGAVPAWTSVTWQTLSVGLLRGRWFSDNLVLVTRRLTPGPG